jgi:hypothetical protein
MIGRRCKPRRGPLRDPHYLAFLREEGKCIVCMMRLGQTYVPGTLKLIRPGNCDPAHGPVNGRSSKGPDDEAMPLCRLHHDEQTTLGWPAFETKYGFDRAQEARSWYCAFQIWQEHTKANPD